MSLQITYLYHSGFLVETRNCFCLFDYYKGTLPALNPDKPVLIFVSHSHKDHYNPEIFTLLQKQGVHHIIAALSKDVKKLPPGLRLCTEEEIRHIFLPSEKLAENRENFIPALSVTFHQTYTLPFGVTVQTLHSTDRGVAYLVRCDDALLYHAGDLNDWGTDETCRGYSLQYNRQMTGNYRHEINLLREWLDSEALDLAFLPLDPRLGNHYDKGILYFLKQIPVKAVYPMHYWEHPEIIERFLMENPACGKWINYPQAKKTLQK